MSFDVLRTMLKSWLARYRVPERTHALWQVPRTWLRSHGWAPQTLVGRMLLLLLVGVVAIYMITVGGLWWTGGKIITDSLRKQAVQWLAELDHYGTPLYVRRSNAKDMQALTARLGKFPEIGYVRYYDANGTRLLGEYTRAIDPPAFNAAERRRVDKLAATDSPYLLSEQEADRPYLRVVAPVRVRSYASDDLFGNVNGSRPESVRTIGYLDFGLDVGYHRTAFRRSLLFGSLAIALVFAAALFMGRKLVKRAFAPLIALQEPLARVARGEREITVGHGGDREIAAITEALNTLLTALRQREQALQRAERDGVTGLANRAYFMRQLERERARVGREGVSSAIVVIVLDQHNAVRDELGAVAGDRLLAQAAALLRAHLREDDMLARLGVNQFAALVRNVGREGAIKVARAIARVTDEFHFTEGDHNYAGGAVIGVAMFDSERVAAETLLAQAEAAAAQARMRAAGIGVHEGEDGVEVRRTPAAGWAAHIREAIQDNRFQLLYQPIVPLQHAGQSECYEVLLRLGASGGDLIAPAAFLPIANRSGLLVDVDCWVIRESLAALAALRASGRDVQFFINVSGQTFEDGERLLHVVGEELNRQKLPGSAVVFEITEQVAVRQLDRARDVLEAVQGLQCRFALDDFGSGFSSLSYLKHLPVSFIKMSGTFMEQMTAGEADEVVVRSIIDIARALGKQTIAESVENRHSLRRLTTLGADFAQGYYLGRPSARLPRRPPTALTLLGGRYSNPA